MDLKIHFGCGKDYKVGWVNLDLGKGADYWVDVRNPLKIKTEKVSYIYSSHMIEHLEHHELLFHLQECFRLLKGGGVLRIGIPDFEMLIKGYGNAEVLNRYKNVVSGSTFQIPDEDICYMDLLNRAFYEFGQHKIVINFEKIKKLLTLVGFKSEHIEVVEFDASIDMLERKNATFYVQAIK